jgi:hypothetical protein
VASVQWRQFCYFIHCVSFSQCLLYRCLDHLRLVLFVKNYWSSVSYGFTFFPSFFRCYMSMYWYLVNLPLYSLLMIISHLILLDTVQPSISTIIKRAIFDNELSAFNPILPLTTELCKTYFQNYSIYVQVQGFRLTQHCLNTCLVFYSITATYFSRPNPEPDLVHATGCKQPSLKLFYLRLCLSSCLFHDSFLLRNSNGFLISNSVTKYVGQSPWETTNYKLVVVVQLLKNLEWYEILKFIAMSTRVLHWTLSEISWI